MFATMTAKQHEHLLQFETIGINIKNHTYEECIDILIECYLTAIDTIELTEEERFKRELNRVSRNPSN